MIANIDTNALLIVPVRGRWPPCRVSACTASSNQRHLAGVPWAPNDLSDMVYLSCAASYADFVVSERHMATFLAQSAGRLDPRVRSLAPQVRMLASRTACTRAD